MINGLYDKFKKWSEGGSVYIISDTHFDDEDCKKMDKNWLPPEEQIAILKKTCHKNDTLIHLGDVGNVEWIKKLNCYKVLIMGNHDKGKANYLRENIFIKEYDTIEDAEKDVRKGIIDYFTTGFHSPFICGYKNNKLFDEVYEGPLFISEKILLSHEPIIGLEWCLNIHGHDHSGSYIDNRHVNMTANVCGYKPISLGEYIKSKGMSDIPSLHRIIINNATERKKKKQGR